MATTRARSDKTESHTAVRLRVVPRAGILPEITRQTYESLAKALREAVMNAIDAGATVVHLDFTGAPSGVIRIVDDGEGMSMKDVQDRFLALGGSERADDAAKFGRIGIGSLALLTFGESVSVATRRSSYSTVRATLRMPPEHDGLRPLEDISLGHAAESNDDESPAILGDVDHFTEIAIQGIRPSVANDMQNVASYYDLLDELRRLLPLPPPPSTHALLGHLEREDADLADALRQIHEAWSVRVVAHSEWHSALDLTRRSYGDSETDEPWVGSPLPVRALLPSGSGGQVEIVGYLVALPRANGDWAGVTARVQNVAVTVGTFFGLESDPGFLRYVTGEIHITGDFSKRDLVRIDRASFNETTEVFRGIRQAMQDEIYRFKVAVPQRIQRQRAAGRALCKAADALRLEIGSLQDDLDTLSPTSLTGKGLSSVRADGWRHAADLSPLAEMQRLGFDIHFEPDTGEGLSSVTADGRAIHMRRSVAHPTLSVLGATYNFRVCDLGIAGPPLAVINSPRLLIVNGSNEAVVRLGVPSAARLLIGMQVAEALDGRGGRSGLDWAKQILFREMP